MLQSILLFPVLVIVAALTSLFSYNIMGPLTQAISRYLGRGLRKLLHIDGQADSIGLLAGTVSMICQFTFPLLIFVGMMWTRFGSEAGFFLHAIAIVAALWPLARMTFVLATGDPHAPPVDAGSRKGMLQRLLRRRGTPSGELASRWFTIAPPEGAVAREGYVFIERQVLKWTEGRGPHVVTSIEQVPKDDVFR
jgi:hypothetical protein